MSAHIQQAGMLSGRSMVMAATIGLHALVIGALMAIRVIPEMLAAASGPLEWIPVADPVDPVVAMPLGDPVTKPRKSLTIMAPEFEAEQDADERVIAGPLTPGVGVTDESGPRGDAEPGPAPGLSTDLQYQIVRSSRDYYPPAAVLLDERGVAVVRVCVDATGRTDGAPQIQSSSGSRRLDAAAITWAREALRFTPARRDGVAVPACKGFRVNFTLR